MVFFGEVLLLLLMISLSYAGTQMEMRRRTTHADATSETLIQSPKRHGRREDGLMFLLSSSKRVLAFCLAFRLVNSILIQTYFNPDEHWQSLEVAHHVVFGYMHCVIPTSCFKISSYLLLYLFNDWFDWIRYGHLTWEWKKGIRSYLHPLIFAFLYKVMAFLHLDIPLIMVLCNDSDLPILIYVFNYHAHPCLMGSQLDVMVNLKWWVYGLWII